MDRPTSSFTDRQLVQRTAEHNEEAFEELYQRFSGPIYNYLLRLIHEQDVAEELLQEVFVSVWKGANRFKGRSKVSTWLFRIAHHRAVDWLRKRRPTLLEENRQLLNDRAREPEAEALGAWRVDQVQAALAQLSADHRAILELVFFQELSYRQVARVMDCPVGTVKSRVSYAKRHLNGILRRMGFDSDV
jgi:RNA polymerase sigma-70 factor (ECF subfamily)